MTITIGPKRKNRYFHICYGVKTVPVPAEAQPGTAPVTKTIPLMQPGKNSTGSEMTIASINLTVSPDPATKEKTPFISRGRVTQMIQENHPDVNYIVIMNITEMQEKDFLQWNS